MNALREHRIVVAHCCADARISSPGGVIGNKTATSCRCSARREDTTSTEVCVVLQLDV